MYPKDLVFGLLDISDRLGSPGLAATLRDLTVSWSRYGYQQDILEDASVDTLLERALDLGYRWCLIQAYGHIIHDEWQPRHWHEERFEDLVERWTETHDFFVLGNLTFNEPDGFGLDDQFLLVDLRWYEKLGRPGFGSSAARLGIKPAPVWDETGKLRSLGLSGTPEWRSARAPGWKWIEASLSQRLPVCSLPAEMSKRCLPLAKKGLACLERCLRDAIATQAPGTASDLSWSQQRFVEQIAAQVNNARRGVGLWNFEPYDDVAQPPPLLMPPITTLYSVACGFKPHFLLHSVGFTAATRVVYFDYSPQALEIKKLLLDDWDGEDFPHFLRHYLFAKKPFPETFYRLWAGFTPETVPWADMCRLWLDELDRWGGVEVFRDHWKNYRALRHEFVLCDVLEDPAPLLARVSRSRREAIWWGNAFFSVHGNWLYPPDKRLASYKKWIDGLADRNPLLWLYGSDPNNSGVNHIQAGPYQEHLLAPQDGLTPNKHYQVEMRF